MTQPSLANILTCLTAGAPLPALTADAWDLLSQQMLAHDLAPFVYARLRSTAAWPALPAATRARLSASFQSFSLRTYFLENELAHIVAALAAVGVPVMLLKGAALGRLVYDSPVERPLNDFDLLVPPDQVTVALRALAARGYEAQSLFWLSAWQRRYRAEVPLICRARERWRLLLELHWALLELPYYIDAIPGADIWQNAVPAPGLPGAFVPDPATLLLHSCAHAAFHHSHDERLLWLLDVERLLRLPTLDWEIVLARATRWKLSAVLFRRLALAQSRLGASAPPTVMARLAHSAPDRWEQRMIGLGDEQPGRAWRRARISWLAFGARQRLRYSAWLGLRSLLWLPETIVRLRQQRAARLPDLVKPSYDIG